MVYGCDCSLISPTTILASTTNIIGASKAQGVFSSSGLSSFIKIQFWKYAIFYVALILSGIYATFTFYGFRKDNEDFIDSIVNELDVVDRDFPELIRLKNQFPQYLSKLYENVEENKDIKLSNIEDYKEQLKNKTFAKDGDLLQ